MDVSLVLLAEKANLSICDILYEPCSRGQSSWDSAKCNDNKQHLDKQSAQELYKRSIFTKELEFYKIVLLRFRKSVANSNIENKLKQYLHVRSEALKACSTPASSKAWESLF